MENHDPPQSTQGTRKFGISTGARRGWVVWDTVQGPKTCGGQRQADAIPAVQTEMQVVREMKAHLFRHYEQMGPRTMSPTSKKHWPKGLQSRARVYGITPIQGRKWRSNKKGVHRTLWVRNLDVGGGPVMTDQKGDKTPPRSTDEENLQKDGTGRNPPPKK